MHTSFVRTSVLAAVLLAFSHPGRAQTLRLAVPPAVPGGQAAPVPMQPQTLEDFLRSIPIGPGRCVLAVGASSLRLPPDTAPPLPPDGLAGAADAFGLFIHRFGPVTALAPPAMTLLNTDLHDPQIFDGMPTGDALKLLCGTLTDAQWAVLTGERGLGVSDLSSGAQQSLFQACLGTQTLKVWSSNGGGPSGEIDLTADLPQARLRLGCTTEIELPVSDHEWVGGGAPDRNTGAPHYLLDRSETPQVTLYGNIVKTVVPNVPKRSDLDFKTPALQTPIPLASLKTVGDLVYRIGRATKTELYADPHYAGRALTVLAGPVPSATGDGNTKAANDTPAAEPSAPAADLLRALALCLTATYRQVGPAYVLTDDLVGLGVRRQNIADFGNLAQQMRRKPLDDAGDALTAQHGLANLHAFGDTEQAPTADEQKKGQNNEFSADTPGQYLRLTLSDLTSAQQAIARTAADAAANQPVQGDAQHPPSLDGTLLLVTTPKLELLVPSLPGPVDLGGVNLYDLFRPSQKVMNARMEAQRKAAEADASKAAAPPAKPVAPAPPPPPLAQVLAGVPRRAVLVDVRTPDDVAAAVTAMKAAGLNQLWLPVFTEGRARIPGTPLSDPAAGSDVLAEALKATKGTGIAVFAVLDLLRWGVDATATVQDLTLHGDNSAQAMLRQARQNTDPSENGTVSLSPAQKRLVVSPFSQDVRQKLLTVVRAVGASPGVAGIVWRESAPTGYATNRFQDSNSFGYSVEGRLAFLRAEHTDPIDIGGQGQVDTSLPSWDGAMGLVDQSAAWNNYRVGADEDLLRALLAAWPSAGLNGGTRRVFVQQRRDSWQGDWFGSWDSPRAPLPAFHASWERLQNEPSYPDDPARQAKGQSHLALLHVESWAASSPENLASYLNDQMKKPWDGFVLVYDEDEGGLKALQALADAMHPAVLQSTPRPH